MRNIPNRKSGKMTARLLGLVLALTLLLSSLTSCGFLFEAIGLDPEQLDFNAILNEMSGSKESAEGSKYEETDPTLVEGFYSGQLEDGTYPVTAIVFKGGTFDLSAVALYDGTCAWAVVNDNQPYFGTDEITMASFELYGDLDSLGRCTSATSSVGQDLMPTEDRGSIGSVKPTGWHTVKYDCVDAGYLYNRCHLIGYQLTGENANKQNLITGTRYLNVVGMLPFEDMVTAYVKETGNHVMYRVTPVFIGDNLVAHGVLMEGYSVEDEGDGICYCVFCYNVQPGVTIRYSDGESWEIGAEEASSEDEAA